MSAPKQRRACVAGEQADIAQDVSKPDSYPCQACVRRGGADDCVAAPLKRNTIEARLSLGPGPSAGASAGASVGGTATLPHPDASMAARSQLQAEAYTVPGPCDAGPAFPTSLPTAALVQDGGAPANAQSMSDILERFGEIAPLFRQVMIFSQYRQWYQTAEIIDLPLSAVDHAISAIANLHSSGPRHTPERSVQSALQEISGMLDRGEVSQAGDVILALSLLLYYHLHQGVWLQNCRLSSEAMGFCNSAGLHLDPGRMPPGHGYATGPVELQGLYTHPGRLFWGLYILYIQVVSCSTPFSLSMIKIDDISLPLPQPVDRPSGTTPSKHVWSDDLYSIHEGSDWFGIYVKAALLLGRTQEMVRRAVSRAGVGSAFAKGVVDGLESDLMAFQLTWHTYDVSDAYSEQEQNVRRMTIRAMIAMCHLLPREPNVQKLYGDPARLTNPYIKACEDVAADAASTEFWTDEALHQVPPIVFQVWMLVIRSCKENGTPERCPGFFKAGIDRPAEFGRRCTAALERVATRGNVPAARSTMNLTWLSLAQRYPRENWQTKVNLTACSQIEHCLGIYSDQPLQRKFAETHISNRPELPSTTSVPGPLYQHQHTDYAEAQGWEPFELDFSPIFLPPELAATDPPVDYLAGTYNWDFGGDVLMTGIQT